MAACLVPDAGPGRAAGLWVAVAAGVVGPREVWSGVRFAVDLAWAAHTRHLTAGAAVASIGGVSVLRSRLDAVTSLIGIGGGNLLCVWATSPPSRRRRLRRPHGRLPPSARSRPGRCPSPTPDGWLQP
ncbi:hypothetical protein [Streptomyces roseifaciens]|uniref:hypothetical protein n=1 Tax=Streptomyces roseifaciens TaxID=1488406 RepID=UPI000ABD7843|nr:hypothetical protein [Streptomyces roseifaciens]